MFKGGMGMNGMQGMLKKVQKMQSEMLKLQDELKERTVEATAGGEAVKVVVNGSKNVVSLAISPEAVDPDDVEMLQDLIVTAVNEAMKKVDEMTEKEMGKVTGGMKLPGMWPTEYNFSSKSTLRGKKSMPSRGFSLMVTLHSTRVSP